MLGIIIVAYKNPERTADYINVELKKLVNPHVVVVVNNSSTFQECEQLGLRCGGVACEPDAIVGNKSVYIVHSSQNLGYAKGNNLGVRFLSKNYPCDYILISNDDIILPDSMDLTPMIDLLNSDDKIGAIGPAIVGMDGHHQSPHRRVITAYRQIGWILFSKLRKKKKISSEGEIKVADEGFCYWVSGAFFIMKTDDFNKVEGFDSDTFLYSEEPILAERLKRIGKSMYFYPLIKVQHLEGATTGSQFHKDKISSSLIESNCIYYKKYLYTPKIIVNFYKFLSLRNL